MIEYLLILSAVVGAVVLSYRRPDATEAAIGWVIKWRRRIAAVAFVGSIFIAFGTGVFVLQLYAVVSVGAIVAWAFTHGPLEGML